MFLERLRKSGINFWCWVGLLFFNFANLLFHTFVKPSFFALILFGMVVWCVFSLKHWWQQDNVRLGYVE